MDTDSLGDVSHLVTKSGWLPHERALALVRVAATALAFYGCYRLASPFFPALTWALALVVVTYPLSYIAAFPVS